MYETSDTIVAISSPPGPAGRIIIRLSGPKAFAAVSSILPPDAKTTQRRGLDPCNLQVEPGLEVPAFVYRFPEPKSYTGDDVAELHLLSNSSVAGRIYNRLLIAGARPAGPGEFTARAYLNGRMDLPQAEAVAEIVASSNRLQLAAAQRLLAGRLEKSISAVREELLELITLLEAGLDFSGEDIEFISPDEAALRLENLRAQLSAIENNPVSDEATLDLPAVGIAGLPNAGKSSLLNALLGRPRSIVSPQAATTRDVLTGVMHLEGTSCVLFDCAGLGLQPADALDELGRRAALEALKTAETVVFCADVTKKHWNEDLSLLEISPHRDYILAATKCDLLDETELQVRLKAMAKLFRAEIIATSTRTGHGLPHLRDAVDKRLQLARAGATESAEHIALTRRHRDAVGRAKAALTDAGRALAGGEDEAASMLLRLARQALGTIETEQLDEQVLQRIFSRFCIGK